MAFTNNVMIVRHKLLERLVALWKENLLVEKIDRVPLEFSPRRSQPVGRCCIHKERAVTKYKSLPLLGWDMTDEDDELTPLSEYAKRALSRTHKVKDNILCVIDEACSSCVQVNYEVSNLCRGCVARSCYTNCPKEAIHFDPKTGQAHIDHDTCISCGLCHKNCPYHAIVYIPVPCEEACPVKAIAKDERNIEHIDESKCIYCGKCLKACPFGAIFEISQVFDVLELEEGQKFMTTSCCPSYIELVNKHIPSLKPYVSGTGSPMYYAARIAKKKYPDAKIVFIGPCIAKRKEAQGDECVDFVITFLEMNSIFKGMGIDLTQSETYSIAYESVKEAHGFAQAGGVAGAVKSYLGPKGAHIKTLQFSDFNKKSIGQMRAWGKTGKVDAQFIEMMACEGGCVTGPGAFNDPISGKRQLNQDLSQRTHSYEKEKE